MPSVEYTQAKGLVTKQSTSATLDLRGALGGHRQKLVTVSADVTLKTEDSGKIFLAAPAANRDISLPADPVDGTKYKVICTADAGAGEVINIKQAAGGDDFIGTVFQAAAAVDRANIAANDAAEDDHSVVFAAEKAKAGDFVDLVWTNSNWAVYAACQADGIAFDAT